MAYNYQNKNSSELEKISHEIIMNESLSEDSINGEDMVNEEDNFLKTMSKEEEYDKVVFERISVRKLVKSNTHFIPSYQGIRISEDITKIIVDMTEEDFSPSHKRKFVSCKVTFSAFQKNLDTLKQINTNKNSDQDLDSYNEIKEEDSSVRSKGKSIKFSTKKVIFEYPKEIDSNDKKFSLIESQFKKNEGENDEIRCMDGLSTNNKSVDIISEEEFEENK